MSPKHPIDLPAEVFFLSYQKKLPLRSVITNLLGTEEVNLRALGEGLSDIAAAASTLMRILPGTGGGGVGEWNMGGGGVGRGGGLGGAHMMEGGLSNSSSSSGNSHTHSALNEGTPSRPQYYFK